MKNNQYVPLSDDTKAARLIMDFYHIYSPYVLTDFKYVPRNPMSVPRYKGPDGDRLYDLACEADAARGEDPFSGARVAAKFIFAQIFDMLDKGDGVTAERIIAWLGAYMGHECMYGIMNSFITMTNDGAPASATGDALSIHLTEPENGERFIKGDRIDNQFGVLCRIAGRLSEPPAFFLNYVGAQCNMTMGTPQYWKTGYDEKVGRSPKEISRILEDGFEPFYDMFCIYPEERAITCALALQIAIDQVEKFTTENLTAIFVNYGLRTAHFFG